MTKVIINYSDYNDGDFAVLTQHIVNSLTGNASFATPVPALTDVQTAIDNYTAALAAMASGGKQQTVIKNQDRDALQQLISQLGMYVQLHCNNDEAIALSSGFSLGKPHTPVGKLAKPENLKAVPGMPGEINLSVNAVAHAYTYLWHYKLVTDTDWTDMHTSKASLTLEGLTSGQQYVFAVAALGTDPAQNWSDEVKSFVL